MRSKHLSTDVNKPDKNKILFIDTITNFDMFTNKYGYILKTLTGDIGGMLGIKWIDVAKDFKGIGVNDNLYDERFFVTKYDNKEYYSWWDCEYCVNDFAIFERS